jgi:hypothetical protein
VFTLRLLATLVKLCDTNTLRRTLPRFLRMECIWLNVTSSLILTPDGLMIKRRGHPIFTLLSPVMTSLPITPADTAPSNTSQSCADMQAETGERFICLRYYKPHRGTFLSEEAITPDRISDEVSSLESSDKETMPLPLEVFIPEDHLPDVLDVYDTDTFLSATWYHVPYYKQISDAVWKSWAKFLARCPIKFVRESPRVRTYSMLKYRCILIPTPPSSPLYLQRRPLL